jgi:hypothetical protein
MKISCLLKWLCPFFAFLGIACIFFSCDKSDGSKKSTALFEELTSEKTGITFTNTVIQSGENHILNYSYYFNGGGVAVGDVNNDGLVDVYFSGNQVSNKLYLNKGNFQFEDVTDRAGVGVKTGWKTGATLADVNADGWLDIYVCRSAMADSTLRENLLFINNGDLTFTEKGKQFGVADDSYSTHASFFDYDRDGDLDLFVLNHSLPKYAGFNRFLKDFKNQKTSTYGSKLFRNDNGKYHDVSEGAGLISNVLSYGLGLAVSDVDQDGWLDIYVSNDFNEEDYLYINQKDGTFKNTIRDATGHVSLFSMGSDIADINNDALPDILSLDMMPETNERIKLSSGDDNYDKYQMLIEAGFHHQSMRNMLQLNNGNGTFSEIGQLAGISNTDWSWAALFADFDGDGWKDVFISNGYEKDYTNMQFLKFTVDEQLKARQTGTPPNVQLILDRMPAIEVGNYVFRNNGNLTFSNQSKSWGISRKFKSNGATYSDLDNDGDPDLLINVMNGPAAIYKNRSAEDLKSTFLSIDLSKASRPIVGTKIFSYQGDSVQYYEYSADRGFQSSQDGRILIGTGGHEIVDSIRIVWPDQKTEVLKNVSVKDKLAPAYGDAVKTFTYKASNKPLLREVQSINWTHSPIITNDFKRQFLLPKMYSYSGPRIAKGDVNGDGLEDVYICAPHNQESSLYIQKPDSTFAYKKLAWFQKDKGYQDEDAVFFDADNDKDLDLYVVSGGYLFERGDNLLQDRLYINDGKGNFVREENRIPHQTSAGSCVVSFDVDGDTDLDLFVGNGIQPGRYPEAEQSQILLNDGKGNFANGSDNVARDLKDLGIVKDAIAADLNGDKVFELIVAGEWTAIRIFTYESGKLTEKTKQWFAATNKGWWNSLHIDDFDKDGDKDLLAGNYGQNNQFHVSAERPLTLIYKDFDNDDQIDPFFCYHIGDTSYPYASRDEALSQVSFLKRRFTDYAQYSNATMQTIFKEDELMNSKKLDANVLETMYFENTGNTFVARPLPIEAQFSPVYAIASVDVDKDGDHDVIMGGNESHVRVRLGQSDANRGLILINDGKGNFSCAKARTHGMDVEGDVRSIVPVGNKIMLGITGRKLRTFTF